jgi:aspartyl-tRNA(Asn)/glutamyl-tRNA(Gln) amidotransferase subunit C
MSVTRDDVRKVARLSRIAVPEERLDELAGELNGIHGWIDQLNEVDVEGVEPLTSVVETTLPMRDDVVTDGNIQDQVLANAPRTGRTSPSKASSPITIHSAKRSLQICPEQANNPNAIGRSKHGPAFLRSAGARLAVMKPSGQKYPLFQTAAFTRCRDSFTAVSAKPTTTKFSFPFPASTSTSTGRASTPTTAADQVLAIFLIGSIPPPLH